MRSDSLAPLNKYARRLACRTKCVPYAMQCIPLLSSLNGHRQLSASGELSKIIYTILLMIFISMSKSAG